VIQAVIVSHNDLDDQLRGTLLSRQNVVRVKAADLDAVKRATLGGKVDIILVDAALPGAPALVAALREEPLTRGISIAGLGAPEFGLAFVELLEAGVNAVLPLPPDAEWDDRLIRLVHVPVRKVSRFQVNFAVGVGRGQGEPFTGRALNLSVHGLLLQTVFPLAVGNDLRLAFDLPGMGSVRGTGTVVRLEPPGCTGIELTSVEGDGRVRIKRFVEASPA
jgi:CheY-like chemotaxis protein